MHLRYRQPEGLQDAPYVSRRVVHAYDFTSARELADVVSVGTPTLPYLDPASPIGVVEMNMRNGEEGTMQMQGAPIILATGIIAHVLFHVRVSDDSQAWAVGLGEKNVEVSTRTGIMLYSPAGTRTVYLVVDGVTQTLGDDNPNTENGYMAIEFFVSMCTCHSGKGVIEAQINDVSLGKETYLTIPHADALYPTVGVVQATADDTLLRLDSYHAQVTRFTQTQIVSVNGNTGGGSGGGGGSSSGGGGSSGGGSSCGLNPFCDASPVGG